VYVDEILEEFHRHAAATATRNYTEWATRLAPTNGTESITLYTRAAGPSEEPERAARPRRQARQS